MLNPGKIITALLPVLLALSGCSTVGTPRDNTTSTRAPYDRARKLMEAGRYQQSIPALQQLLVADPDQPELAVDIAIAYQQTGHPDKAVKVLQDVITKHPDHIEALNQLGISQRRLGHFDAALAAYQHAIAIDDDYALAHRNLGILYDIYLGQLENALKQYDKYLALAAGDKEVENWVIDLKRRIRNATKENE